MVRESSASTPPEEGPPTVWEIESIAPRSEDGFCCQANDPEKPSLAEAGVIMAVSSPRARTSAFSPRTGSV